MRRTIGKGKPLGVGSLIYDGELYDGQMKFSSDLPFYQRWCRKAGGPVLELCCGTGRLTLPLAEAGIDICGLDREPSMLMRAREKAIRRGLDVPFYLSDLRGFDLRRTFRLVFIPFNSFQHTYALPDIEAALACVRRHLAKDGLFILDVFNPSIAKLDERGRRFKPAYRYRLKDGRRVVVHERCSYDVAAQVNRVTWRYVIDGRRAPDQQLDMRCFFPQELDALLKYNGFAMVHKFGDIDGRPFASSSPKQLCVLRKA